ncbi:MAG: NAD(P)/FAD-dependent oxidoreductase [Verrucomicrobiota bacterium]|nr:NAD(P)/FAD-dependent oxidoreductase [Chthoniobacterales bacterium]MDQ3414455.1 NAD(P)/FAD-dependent oxidoreductase [Verrucomicrobiota bacterium]
MKECDAVVVGSGPNGLAAAITLARAGCSVRVLETNSTIGGGARSGELTRPGFVHDLCSAIHPLAFGSPFFRTLPLERHGLEWIQPPIALAHPLDHGAAACLRQDLEESSDSLGKDGPAWDRLLRPFVRDWEKLSGEFLQPMLHLPRHPFALARFGLPALFPASALARFQFREEPARALFAGIAAHSFLPLEAIASAAFGLVLGAAGHAVGWPFPRGGAQAISDALAAHLRQLGGEIETNRRIENIAQLPPARAVLFDTTCWQFARIAGPQLPVRYRSRLEKFRHAPGVFKIDYALSAPVPWEAAGCRAAGTLHLGGTLEEIAASERAVAEGRHAKQPFVLVAQQSLFDATRAPENQQTLWAYCHVPHGSEQDMTEAIERQIERFAPGFRDCVLTRHVAGAAALERSNANLVGGDINGGAADLWQLFARPVVGPAPYRTPRRGLYLCSSSTPPGGGVHGMCGYHAARTALRDLFGKRIPALPA